MGAGDETKTNVQFVGYTGLEDGVLVHNDITPPISSYSTLVSALWSLVYIGGYDGHILRILVKDVLVHIVCGPVVESNECEYKKVGFLIISKDVEIQLEGKTRQMDIGVYEFQTNTNDCFIVCEPIPSENLEKLTSLLKGITKEVPDVKVDEIKECMKDHVDELYEVDDGEDECNILGAESKEEWDKFFLLFVLIMKELGLVKAE